MGHTLSDVLAPPQSGLMVRSLIGSIVISWLHLRVDQWDIHRVTSWLHLRMDLWDDHNLIRGCPSNESSHKSIYNDDGPTSNRLK